MLDTLLSALYLRGGCTGMLAVMRCGARGRLAMERRNFLVKAGGVLAVSGASALRRERGPCP
jgi:hypothetical protein